MINGGNATVYVSNMDSAIQFYTEVLGLKLTNRFGNSWATVQAGKTLVIGCIPGRRSTRGRVRRARCRLALSCRRTNLLRSSRLASASTALRSATSSNRRRPITYPSRIRMGTRYMSEIGIQTSTRSTSQTTPWVRQHHEPSALARSDPADGPVASVVRRATQKMRLQQGRNSQVGLLAYDPLFA